ncbi:MAG: class I SAM-dependent methyltransferase [Rhodothermales bacterium]
MGVGIGRFAAPLGVDAGIDPAEEMLDYAAKRGIEAVQGVAEAHPFSDQSVDFALSVTTICFVDDASAMFREAYRILRPCGVLVVGFIERDSEPAPKWQPVTYSS